MNRLLFLGFLTMISTLIFIGCDSVESSSANVSGDWSIPENEVFDGGPGKDGIPALESPSFVKPSSINFMSSNDLVLIVNHNNEVRIYPHPILDWHEIINDEIGNKSFAVTYCPLTGSGICWDRNIDGEQTTFGVSGLLYNTNLIPYDRKTGSNWSQMQLKSVNGALISTVIKTYPIIETSWGTAKNLYPNADVVSANTGFSRSYGTYPYGDYRSNHSSFLFPVNRSDGRLNAKERVLGLFSNNKTKAYRISDFQNGKIIIDTLDNERFLIYGDSQRNIISAFNITNLSNDIEFSIPNIFSLYVISDNKGNSYDLFGNSLNSSSANIVPAKYFVAYWFAWAAFYPETEFFEK